MKKQAYQDIHNWSLRRREEKGKERLSEEIMAPHFPNLMKNINQHIQDAQQILSTINSKIHHNLTVKSNSESILKRAREKQFIMYKVSSVRLTVISHQKPSCPGNMKYHIQNDERKRLSTKNSISGKTVPQKWRIH